MFWLKGCDKCGGDLFMQEDDWQCLQCGTYQYGALPWSQFLQQEGGGPGVPSVGTRNREKDGPKKKSYNGAVRV